MYSIYQKLLDEKGLKNADVARATGISNMTLSDWKKGKSTPKPDKLSIIADHLGVTMDFLIGKEKRILCKECGIFYDPFDKKSKERHSTTHANWEQMKERYGFQWTYEEYKRNEEESVKYVKFNQWSGDGLDTAHYDMYFKCKYWYFLYLRYFDSNITLEDFRTTYILDRIDNDLFTDDTYKLLIEYYKIDDSYSFDNALLSAKLSNNKQLMRILTYAEKLNSRMLDTIEIQLKALAEQTKME